MSRNLGEDHTNLLRISTQTPTEAVYIYELLFLSRTRMAGLRYFLAKETLVCARNGQRQQTRSKVVLTHAIGGLSFAAK